MQKIFTKPTQVKWWDGYNRKWSAGIAIDAIVICAHCGLIVDIDEIYKDAQEDGIENPIQKLKWVDLSEEILGE